MIKKDELCLLGISLLSFAIRAVIVFKMLPLSDVFYVTREGILVLFNLQNPYQHLYTSVPPDLLTAGSEGVFPYLPFTIFYLIPFQLFTSEIRYGLAFSDAVIIYCLGKRSYKANSQLGILLLIIYALFPPFVVLGPLYGNTVTIGVSLFTLSLLIWQKGRSFLAGIVYGMSLASSQFIVLSVPFIYFIYYCSGKFKAVYSSLASFFLIILPFLVQSPREFVSDVLFFQLNRETLPIVSVVNSQIEFNIGFNGLAKTLGFDIPVSVKILLIIILLVMLMLKANVTNYPLRATSIFTFFTVLLLPNMVFYSYYFFPVTVMILHLVKRENLNENDLHSSTYTIAK